MEALIELTYRLQNSNCRGRPGIKPLLFGKGEFHAFALTVKLIWLYLEILRLMGKSRSRK